MLVARAGELVQDSFCTNSGISLSKNKCTFLHEAFFQVKQPVKTEPQITQLGKYLYSALRKHKKCILSFSTTNYSVSREMNILNIYEERCRLVHSMAHLKSQAKKENSTEINKQFEQRRMHLLTHVRNSQADKPKQLCSSKVFVAVGPEFDNGREIIDLE